MTPSTAFRDYRGGGRSSARETVSRVVGGAVAGALLSGLGVEVAAYTVELGGVPAEVRDPWGARAREFGAPCDEVVPLWAERVRRRARRATAWAGWSRLLAGGCRGPGRPVFDKLDARLAYALMGVGAVKAVEVGAGCAAARPRAAPTTTRWCRAVRVQQCGRHPGRHLQRAGLRGARAL
jgi:chorismate synthase